MSLNNYNILKRERERERKRDIINVRYQSTLHMCDFKFNLLQ